MQVVLSAMLTHCIWQSLGHPRCLDLAWYKANHELRLARENSLGSCVAHPSIQVEFTHLQRTNGVHMSNKRKEETT